MLLALDRCSPGLDLTLLGMPDCTFYIGTLGAVLCSGVSASIF